MNKKLKKGFTLAELLIVVAIIAVLTAIAVPLFVTSLQKAQKSADDATISAVRSAAIAYILSEEEPTDEVTDGPKAGTVYTGVTDGSSKTWQLKGPWKAIGTVDSKGNVTNVEVEIDASASVKSSKDTIAKVGDNKSVTVYIFSTTLGAKAAPGAG